MADRSPAEIVAAALTALRGIESDLAGVSPRLRADPAWNEIDKAVKRAIAAAAAVTEYATVRADKFA